MAKTNNITPTHLKSWQKFIPALKRTLKKRGYHSSQIALRFYGNNRTQILLETGTDRDSGSGSWVWGGDAEGLPVNVNGFTYAWTFDISKDPIRPTHYVSFIMPETKTLDEMLERVEENQGIAIYDPLKLSRKSAYQYHFTQDPREALLAVFLKK